MTNLFVSGLAWHTTEESLRYLFSPFGNIVEATVIRDRDTGRSRGFGFVRFATVEQAQSAIQALDRSELDERIIGVSLAQGRGAAHGRGNGGPRGGRGAIIGGSPINPAGSYPGYQTQYYSEATHTNTTEHPGMPSEQAPHAK